MLCIIAESFTVCTHSYNRFCRQRRIQTAFFHLGLLCHSPSHTLKEQPGPLRGQCWNCWVVAEPSAPSTPSSPLSAPTCLWLNPQKDVLAGGTACMDCSWLSRASPLFCCDHLWIESVMWLLRKQKKKGKKSQACCLCASLCMWHSEGWLAVSLTQIVGPWEG